MASFSAGGIEATRRIVHTSPHIGVLVVSMFEDDQSVFAAVQAGARGYILKGARKVEVLRAIRAVAAGEVIFGPAVARRVLAYFAAPKPAAPGLGLPELTELQVTDRTQAILRAREAGIGDLPPPPWKH